jgi:hypothetical protein
LRVAPESRWSYAITVKCSASRAPKASNIEWSASAPWIRITDAPLPLCA